MVVRPPNPIAAGVTGGPLSLRDSPSSAGALDPGAKEAEPIARGWSAHEIVEVLWFDPDALGRIRAEPHFAELLAKLHEDAAGREVLGFDAEPPPEVPQEVLDRRDIVAIMTSARSMLAGELPHAVLDAVDPTGSFEPPVVLVSGRLHFPFDEVEALKATVTLVTPLIAGNKKLKDLIDTVNELLQTPWLQSSGEVADGMNQKVREEFKQGNRMLSPDYLDEHTQRILLQQRHYQKRMVFGDEGIRALMNIGTEKDQIPTYITATLAKKLPMYQSFPARLIVEVHVQQDQYELQDSAFKVLALGRVVTHSKGGGLH
jgi:hypothetical protein